MATVAHGWRILFHPTFARRYAALRAEVERLNSTRSDEEYREHPTVKLFAGVTRLVRQIVPSDPNAPDFRLKADLAKFRRAKGRGLPPRYRLF